MKNLLFILFIATIALACNQKKTQNTENKPTVADTVQTMLHVENMSCDNCEKTIEGSVAKITGIIEIKANYEDSTTLLKFDASKTNLAEISAAIENKGYKVVGEKK